MLDKCPNCGSDIPPQARFCPSCGTPVIPSATGINAPKADDGYARFYADDPAKPAAAPPQPATPSPAAPSSVTPSPVTSSPVTPSVEPAAPPAQPAWTPPVASAPPPPVAPPVTSAPAPAATIAPAAASVSVAPPAYTGGGHDGAGNGSGNGHGGGGDYGDVADDERPARALWPWLAGAAFLVAAGVFAYGYMQDGRGLTPISDTGPGTEGTSIAAPATIINPRVALFVAADANVRDKPTTAGSNVVSKLKRGSEVKGDVVAGAKGDQWLKLEGQEAYISMINLTKDAPVALVSTSSSDATIKMQCPVLVRPEAGAAVKVTLASGAKVKITGLTENGYAEFALPRGGSGYVESEGKPCLSGGEALAINFDPGACDFGPEIEAFFRKVTPVENEGDTSYTAVNRSFRGVPVNSAFTAWETSGLTFDGSIAEVRAAFLAAGYKLDADNNFIPPADSEAVASASLDPRNPSDKRGRTQLSCGV